MKLAEKRLRGGPRMWKSGGAAANSFTLCGALSFSGGERDGAGRMVGESGPQPRTRSLMHARQDGVWINN